MKEFTGVVLTSGVDRQGDFLPDEVLEMIADEMNGERALGFGKPNHNQFCMMYGKFENAWTETRDGRTAIVARCIYHEFARRECHAPSGIEIAILDFSENSRPFQRKSMEKAQICTTVSVDPANFASQEDLIHFKTEVGKIDSSISCDDGLATKGLGEIEPLIQIVFSLFDSEIFWVVIGGGLREFVIRTANSTLERAREDIADFLYARLKSIFEAYKRRLSRDQESSIVRITIQGAIEVNLVVRIRDEDDSLELKLDSLRGEMEKIRDLLQISDSVTFGYERENGWEFLYLTTKTGNLIGASKCFDRTMELHKEVQNRVNSQVDGKNAERQESFFLSAHGHAQRVPSPDNPRRQ